MTGEETTREVARVEPGYVGPGSTLRAWADEAVAAAHIARSLALTPFVPDSLRARVPNDPDEELRRTTANVGAALLVGQEVGLGPMAALRSIDVVNGTPALRALALRALVQAAGHEIYLVESTQTRAIVAGRRHGTEPVQRAVWTIDRARQLGLVARDQWRKQPTAMLVARATAECARMVAADAILGLAYAAEELADGDPVEEPTTERAGRAGNRRTMQRANPDTAARAALTPPPAPVPPYEPPEDDPPTIDEPEPVAIIDAPLPEEPQPETGRMMNAAQRRAVFAHLNDLRIRDDTTRHNHVSALLGRPVPSFATITESEARELLDALHIEVLNLVGPADDIPPDDDDPTLFEDAP